MQTRQQPHQARADVRRRVRTHEINDVCMLANAAEPTPPTTSSRHANG